MAPSWICSTLLAALGSSIRPLHSSPAARSTLAVARDLGQWDARRVAEAALVSSKPNRCSTICLSARSKATAPTKSTTSPSRTTCAKRYAPANGRLASSRHHKRCWRCPGPRRYGPGANLIGDSIPVITASVCASRPEVRVHGFMAPGPSRGRRGQSSISPEEYNCFNRPRRGRGDLPAAAKNCMVRSSGSMATATLSQPRLAKPSQANSTPLCRLPKAEMNAIARSLLPCTRPVRAR